ncbi:MAG: hypothetical protein QHG98_03760, partial [Methanothrix sp.]|nr:hypothetical protein [Methanothrix sp.]
MSRTILLIIGLWLTFSCISAVSATDIQDQIEGWNITFSIRDSIDVSNAVVGQNRSLDDRVIWYWLCTSQDGWCLVQMGISLSGAIPHVDKETILSWADQLNIRANPILSEIMLLRRQPAIECTGTTFYRGDVRRAKIVVFSPDPNVTVWV